MSGLSDFQLDTVEERKDKVSEVGEITSEQNESFSVEEAEMESAGSGDVKKVSIWKRIDRFLELQDADESIRNSNKDLDPLPPSRRTWRGWQLACYWGSDMLQASALRTVVSLMDTGISTRMALLSVTLGYLIIGTILAFNGNFGVRYHVPFAVQARASFGFYLSYLVVLSRLIVGGIFYAVNTYTGAECIRSILYAIWPSFHHVHNLLPLSANITTQTMVCYFIYFVVALPFHYIRQEKIQWIFTLKTILVPLALFGILGWALAAADDPNELWNDGNSVHGSDFSWAFLSCVSNSIASYATLAVNVNDFTRYTDDKKAPYIQIVVLPVFVIFTSCVGLTMAAASKQLWGEALWDPLLVMDHWTSHGGRAASFFLSVIFLFGQIGVNLSANCASAANDLNAMLPRYINIRRGQFLILFIFAWAATPWNILEGLQSFLNFMDGYAIFLGPMAGIIVADMYFVHGMKYDIKEFYNKEGIYRYNKTGCNWRACIAFLIGFAPQLPSFAHSVNASIDINMGMQRFGDVGYFYTFPASAVVYTLLSRAFPAKETIIDVAVYPDNVDFDDEMSNNTPVYPDEEKLEA